VRQPSFIPTAAPCRAAHDCECRGSIDRVGCTGPVHHTICGVICRLGQDPQAPGRLKCILTRVTATDCTLATRKSPAGTCCPRADDLIARHGEDETAPPAPADHLYDDAELPDISSHGGLLLPFPRVSFELLSLLSLRQAQLLRHHFSVTTPCFGYNALSLTS
jgi:hypothetical protein